MIEAAAEGIACLAAALSAGAGVPKEVGRSAVYELPLEAWQMSSYRSPSLVISAVDYDE
jgi:hypothetical protein